MKINFLIFLTSGTLLLIFLYFSEYNFNFCIANTFYIVSYFFPVLFFLIIGSLYYGIKFFRLKASNKDH